MTKTIAYQGEQGAHSHIACMKAYPDHEAHGFASFEDVFAEAEEGRADKALIPIENSIAGRVAEIHQILAHSRLFAIAEHFQPIHHHLLTKKNISLKQLTHTASHMQALAQCRQFLQKHNLTALPFEDTAAAARHLAQEQTPATFSAIASEEAAQIYGLTIAQRDIQDAQLNVTRFLVLTTHKKEPPVSDHMITSIMFATKNKPAALYKALGGFAQESINLTRLEGMVRDQSFRQAAFYADVESHPQKDEFKRALSLIKDYVDNIKIIGCYKAHPHRLQKS